MSKCQARKFLAGGRCAGTSSPAAKEDTQGVQTSFSQLLAQREAMDTKMWSSSSSVTEPATQTKKPIITTIVVAEKQQMNKQQQKEADIQCLLGDDY